MRETIAFSLLSLSLTAGGDTAVAVGEATDGEATETVAKSKKAMFLSLFFSFLPLSLFLLPVCGCERGAVLVTDIFSEGDAEALKRKAVRKSFSLFRLFLTLLSSLTLATE